jgi:phosphopantothenoylcysteine decarboxylase/phosphopantothenate--cysteine ligase
MLKNKKILICVTGGIAAYKAVELVSTLKKNGAETNVILTKNALKFVSSIVFHSISGNKPYIDNFDDNTLIPHIYLSDWADIIVIAPATANIIGKVANGIADDLLTSTIIASVKPIVFIPAMNINMYSNQIVQKNIQYLESLNYYFLEPESGILACGTIGKGRYPKTSEIISAIKLFINYKKDLVGKNVLISAGACRESLDPMRFLSNHSSGRMGIALARSAALRGANVTLVHSVITVEKPHYVKSIQAISADEMYEVMTEEAPKNDIIIMSAAVTDYKFAQISQNKIKKSGNLNLALIRTKDILAQLGKDKTDSQTLVGFAAETDDIIENGLKKLEKKNLDWIVCNHLNVSGNDETKAIILSKDSMMDFSGSKFELANKILTTIINQEN